MPQREVRVETEVMAAVKSDLCFLGLALTHPKAG
ncbi:MAG: hypothetical protein ACI9KS_001555 [Sulfitobacter sp.]|jgi:hypothetical protein